MKFSVIFIPLKAEIIMTIDPSKKAKIKWQCRRGMLELDLILNAFIDTSFDNLSEEALNAFEMVLASSDPVLYHWLMGNGDPENKELIPIVDLIRMQYSSRKIQ